MRVEYKYYIVLQRDSKNLAIFRSVETAADVLSILKQLNASTISRLIKQGKTEEDLAKIVDDAVLDQRTAAYFGKGKTPLATFSVFVQAEKIIYHEEEEEENGQKLNS